MATSPSNEKGLTLQSPADSSEIIPLRHSETRYDLEVVPEQNYKATEFKLGSLGRPHMRALHCAWFGCFIAKAGWFSVGPLLPYVQVDLGLADNDIWNSTLVGLTAIVIARLTIGPLCDVYGARVPLSLLLCLTCLPTALFGLVQSVTGLYVQRFFSGIAFGTVVAAEFWASSMFAKQVVGTADGMVAGWSDLSSSMTFLIMGSVLLPLFQAMTRSDTTAWRTVCVVPAAVALGTGVLIYQRSDDTPRGNYSTLKRTDPTLANRRPIHGFVAAASDPNAWVLAFQYACCFGLELAMNAAVVAHFQGDAGLSWEAAEAITGIFGWLEFCARPLGGMLSDLANARSGIRGRLWVHATVFALQGAMILVFANSRTLGGSIAALVVMSLAEKCSEGSTFAIVPYVRPMFMGSVMGLVGAGGAGGAIVFSCVLRDVPYKTALTLMGCAVLFSSVLSSLIFIQGHRSLLRGRDRNVDLETGRILRKGEGGGGGGGGGGGSSAAGSEVGSDRHGSRTNP